jgi:D-arginine dehydrogenase
MRLGDRPWFFGILRNDCLPRVSTRNFPIAQGQKLRQCSAEMASNSSGDFLVIGAGIAGASAAFELSRHGRVILLEQESSAGYHTTGRSAAQYLESYGNLSTRQLTRGARSFFEQPPDEFTGVPLLRPRSALFFAREDQRSILESLFDTVSALTPSVELLDAGDARALVPALREGHVVGAMLEPEAMEIDVSALHQGFLNGARRRGTTLVMDAAVQALDRRHGHWAVTTRSEVYSAPVVVDAAGAWCDQVARLADVPPIGLVPKRRTVITFAAPPLDGVEHWPLSVAVDETVYFKPESGQLLASPCDETPSAPCDAQPDEIDVAIVVDRLERATTLEVPRIERRWAGLRSFVEDKSLVVGADAAVDGFYWVAAQGGYGIQTSPSVARAIAGLVVDGDLPTDLRDLGLSRDHLSPARLR